MFGINCRSRLAPALPLSLRCFDEVDFVCFDSHLVDFTVFDSCRFGFVFDGFFFEFADWIAFQVGIGRYFVVFGSLLKRYLDSTPSVAISKETFLPTIFCWF